jgi:hypothetical protein
MIGMMFLWISCHFKWKGPYKNFINHEVVKLTTIFTNGHSKYPEALNIVIENTEEHRDKK